MEQLIQKLEAATEGSKRLDYEIWRNTGGAELSDWEDRIWPAYTTSLDAALSLVPEGLSWFAEMNNGNAHAGAHWPKCDPASQFGHAATAPLALCIAALKARSLSHTRKE